jgi:hypothetical protein
MRIRIGTVAGLLLILAMHASAGIQFEYRQTTHSDVEALGSSDVRARVTMEGDRSRIEYLSGSIYPPGTYLISMDGSRRMLFVSPATKSYAEVDYSTIAQSLGANTGLTVTNLKSDMKTIADTPRVYIAGFPTDHYRLEMTYDMTVVVVGVPLKQTVRTVIDKWTTTAFGDYAAALLEDGGLRTGHASLDAVIDAETTNIKGFPMRQIVEISTTMHSKSNPGSQLRVNPSRRQRTEMNVTSIRKTDVLTSLFEVPRHFQKLERGEEAKKDKDGPVHILNMEPSTDTDG